MTRELDSRINDGLQVSLLWCEHDGRLWVAVVDTKRHEAFRVRVRDGERPLEVFHHPYAYAAHHSARYSPRPPTSNQPSRSPLSLAK